MTKPDEPAFPNKRIKMFPDGSVHENAIEYGLTKREYFAGLAMQGWIMAGVPLGSEGVASEAVRCADTLIAELAKEKP